MNLTAHQQRIADLLSEGMSQREIAKELDVARGTVSAHVERIKRKAAAEGADPGYLVSGKSTLYGPDGQTKLEWVKTTRDQENVEQIAQAVINGLSEDIPRIPKTQKPKIAQAAKDFMNCFVFGDAHLNMRAWGSECMGRDWDLKIAVQRHREAILDLVRYALPAGFARLISLGDLLHNDSLRPQTFSGTDVDTDGRMSLALDETVLLLRYIIALMLTKYSFVEVVIARGNHPPTMELVIAKMLAIAYEKEPRVKVIDNTAKHIPLVWEKNFQLVTHGDKLNHQKKADIATSIYRDLHGAANFTHVLSGHLHHHDSKTLSGVRSEIFEVLPTPDAWHTESGFVTSDQSACVIRYHKNGGIADQHNFIPRFYMEAA